METQACHWCGYPAREVVEMAKKESPRTLSPHEVPGSPERQDFLRRQLAKTIKEFRAVRHAVAPLRRCFDANTPILREAERRLRAYKHMFDFQTARYREEKATW